MFPGPPEAVVEEWEEWGEWESLRELECAT